ncbi:hypothetical protein BC937DRAFT_87808 [Endogone sp. FLAS-F59071]|nr:hypothetical protein BC937DRAFT_87808 [Endogone sp. FLAS-F59071]|eukprot:RUS19223.1 hypothetical protein BC937DRAFT_87808 [Endogone sp. FLAS-F59071]
MLNYLSRLVEISQEWDLLKVLLVHVGLSLLGSLATHPTYNLPIFLFAIWTYHYHETNDPFKTFLALLSLSIPLDIWWFILHGSSNESGFVLALIMDVQSDARWAAIPNRTGPRRRYRVSHARLW